MNYGIFDKIGKFAEQITKQDDTDDFSDLLNQVKQ